MLESRLCRWLQFKALDHMYASGITHYVLVFLDCLLCVSYLFIPDPGIVFPCPSLPLDEVVNDFSRFLSLSSMNHVRSWVKDFFDLVFFFVFDEVGWWWWWSFLIWEGGWYKWSQEFLIETWVNLPVGRQFEFICAGTCFVKDQEGSDMFVV